MCYVQEALHYSKQCMVDIAFVYCRTPEHVEAAKQLIEQRSGVQVVLFAEDGRYALQAWQIQASGYLLIPYTQEELERTVAKHRFSSFAARRVVIQTLPSFAVTVDGRPMHISAAKPRELLALLVDCAERGLTTAEGISLLWPDRCGYKGKRKRPSPCRSPWRSNRHRRGSSRRRVPAPWM